MVDLTTPAVEKVLALGRLVPQSRPPWRSELGIVIDAARKVADLAREVLRLRQALAHYADPAEWHAAHGEPWRLRYNSSDLDDHGWAAAAAALGRDPDPDQDKDNA